MKENNCEYEQDVLKSLKLANSDPELANHIAQCPNCQETVKVANWMQAFSATTKPKSLSKPGFIRWKAQIKEKQAKAERATQPIIWMQIAAILLTIVAVAWMLIKNQSPFAPILKILSASLELVAMPMFIGFICAGFVCFMFVYKWRHSGGRK